MPWTRHSRRRTSASISPRCCSQDPDTWGALQSVPQTSREGLNARAVVGVGVHLLTASGALLGFLTVTATASGDYRSAFLWMAVATAIDSADGALARAARVKQRLPGFDGHGSTISSTT